jgi:hypothetical protein
VDLQFILFSPKAPVPHSLIKVRSELSLHKKKRRGEYIL